MQAAAKIIDPHPGPGRRQIERHGAANAAPGAGHQGNLAIHQTHLASSDNVVAVAARKASILPPPLL